MESKKGMEKEEGVVVKFLNKKISRRQFIKYSVIGIGGLAAAVYGYNKLFRAGNPSKIFPNDAPAELWKWSKEAYYYKNSGDTVNCELCPNKCVLEPEDRSRCRNKVNKNGKLYTIAYGNPCAVHVDPIEKKPLFHFLPESTAFSIATAGCNYRCLGCQNWDISQSKPEETQNYDMFPESVVDNALSNKCQSIAYTYSEPIAFYEYMYDTAKIAKKNGIKNVWITNGYINEKPLRDLAQYIDAANVNLKAFRENIAQELNGGSFKPILETLKTLKEEKVWFEVTNLVVPGWTDNINMIKDMVAWLYNNGFSDYPLHFSRFTPMYKLAYLPQTPLETLKQARKIALDAGMKYVYIGNVPGTDAENTYCPKCNKIVIARKGYTITENNLANGSCKFCGQKIPGIWGA